MAERGAAAVYLLEADVVGVLAEASAADHQAVLANKAVSVVAHSAAKAHNGGRRDDRACSEHSATRLWDAVWAVRYANAAVDNAGHSALAGQ